VRSEGPSEIHYALGGRLQAFHCTVRTSPYQGERVEGSTMRLGAIADGEEIFARTLAQDEPRFDGELALEGRSTLVISLDHAGDGFLNDALVLCDPRFR